MQWKQRLCASETKKTSSGLHVLKPTAAVVVREGVDAWFSPVLSPPHAVHKDHAVLGVAPCFLKAMRDTSSRPPPSGERCTTEQCPVPDKPVRRSHVRARLFCFYSRDVFAPIAVCIPSLLRWIQPHSHSLLCCVYMTSISLAAGFYEVFDVLSSSDAI